MIDLTRAVVYDIETFPNVFTLNAQSLNDDASYTWEISQYRDERRGLLDWFNYLATNQIPMIGFNTLNFDYPVIHALYKNPQMTVAQLYEKAMSIINSFDKFGHQIWQSDRFAPQIDLFRINHFDNKAKTTSLKSLQFNMRSHTIMESSIPFGTHVNDNEVSEVVTYNVHDTAETKQFAHFCMDAIKFRMGLTDEQSSMYIKGDVLNFNDTKIGEQLLIQRIGEDICFTPAYRDDGGTYHRKQMRQTYRSRIALRDIIFPYIKFNNPEFQRVHTWMLEQVLTPEDLQDGELIDGNTGPVATKGVFKGIVANVGGVEFKFGTGGIHASVPPQRVLSSATHAIIDDDVKGYYPNAAVVNKVAPAHLGEAYTREYGKLAPERDDWQKRKGKKCVEANALKLAGNGVYGKSNSMYSCFLDAQYTMTVTINCQLLLCMLAEWLLTVPTLQIIQANTDGITYRIHRDYIEQSNAIKKQWEQYTCLTLETAEYTKMFIRDVNNYIAVDTKDGVKQKGAYWHPDPLNYAKSISESQPPAWHKDLGNCISIRAAVIAMVHGVDPAVTIKCHTDKFDFMLRAKVGGESKLMLGARQLQKTSRYYVAVNGDALTKISPATGTPGAYKKANGITEYEYQRVMAETGGAWDARVCTKNKSKYDDRITAFEAGFKVAECNNADDFRFDNVNYQYYIDEARKLII